MNIKEQENQMELNMSFKIIVCVLLWLGLTGYISFRLWKLANPQITPSLNTNGVPVIKAENLDTLRSSIKSPHSNSGNLPIVRTEPFD